MRLQTTGCVTLLQVHGKQVSRSKLIIRDSFHIEIPGKFWAPVRISNFEVHKVTGEE